VELSIPGVLPEPGATTAQLKALNQEFGPHEATFEFEAQGGSAYELPLRINRSGVTAEGGTISGDKVHIAFPAGSGYVRKVLKFRW